MRCDDFLDRYDLLDAGEEPGLRLRFHRARCPGCRAKADALDSALGVYAESLDDEASARNAADEELADKVMAAVRLMPKPKRELHARDWGAAGFVLFGAAAIIPFDHNFTVIKEIFGTSYSLPLALVMGLALTVFGAVFIATHINELEPLLKRYLRGI